MIHNSVSIDPLSTDSSHWGASHCSPLAGGDRAVVLAQVSGPGGEQARLALLLGDHEPLIRALHAAADATDGGSGFAERETVIEAVQARGAESFWSIRAVPSGQVAVRFVNVYGDDGEAVMTSSHTRAFAGGLEEQAALLLLQTSERRVGPR